MIFSLFYNNLYLIYIFNMIGFLEANYHYNKVDLDNKSIKCTYLN